MRRLTLLLGLPITICACSSRKPAPSQQREATAASAQAAATFNGLPTPDVIKNPIVTLDGRLSIGALPRSDKSPKIYARSLRTWIYEAPNAASSRLGAFRLGAALPIRPGKISGPNCPRGYYAVIPNGFVCAGDDATLDAQDPLVRIGADFPPDISRRLPFLYGVVRRPGPIYRKLPEIDEQKGVETELDERMKAWLSAPGETGASYGQDLWMPNESKAPDPKTAWETKQSDSLPWFLATKAIIPLLPGKLRPTSELLFGRMEPRVGYSVLATFLHAGRRFGLTADLQLIPTDRLRPIRGSSFHGFRIPEDIDFPFAIVRSPGARFYAYEPEGNRLIPKDEAPYRAAFKLTGKQSMFKNRLHYEATNGMWLSDKDASRLDPAKKMPAWGKNGEKWIDVNVTKQTLVLYEGVRAVYATLVSTGEAGLDDAEDSTATQRGIFRIHTKYLTATMASEEVGEEFELRDVPYVQYFEKGYALHAAYWHDRFGIPKSHGCINLAPEDARRVFFWTQPALPTGYHAVLSPLKGTVVFIHP